MFRSLSCIFPEVNTPLKKVLCATTGIGLGGLSVYGTFYGIRKISTNNITNTNNTNYFTKTTENREETREKNKYTCMRVPVVLAYGTIGQTLNNSRDPISVGISLSISTFFGYQFASMSKNYVNHVIDFIKNIHNDTKCCTIVRNSMYHTILIPPVLFFGITSSLVITFIFMNNIQRIIDIKNNGIEYSLYEKCLNMLSDKKDSKDN